MFEVIPTLTSTATASATHSHLPTVLPDHPIYEGATKAGHNTLWIVFIIMLISTAVFAFLTWRVPVQKRLFYQITTYITLFATLSYYAMATHNGYRWHYSVDTHKHKHDIPDTHNVIVRQVYYARYIDWLVTTPLLLLDLSLLAGLNGSNILTLIIADIAMILTGLFAAFKSTTSVKWGWYFFGWVAFGVIIFNLGIGARATATKRNVQKIFVPLAVYTLVLWTLYPIVWAFADGGRRLTVNQEIIAYAILDVLAKPVFGTALLLLHKRTPASSVSLGGFWSEGVQPAEGNIRVGDDDEA